MWIATANERNTYVLMKCSYLQYEEEGYFTFSYTPVRDDTGDVMGVMSPVTETTNRVLSERRMKLLRELSNKASVVIVTPTMVLTIFSFIDADHDHKELYRNVQ